LTEKAGLSFPLGMAIMTFLMVIMDQANIPLTVASLLIGETILLAGFCIPVYRRRKDFMDSMKNSFSKQSFKNYNLVWLFFIIAIVYMEYMNYAKCLFFPPFDVDSLNGFDTIGYIISQDHTLKDVSIFDTQYISGIFYATYMPLVQLCYAYVYTLGAATSKIIPGLMFLFFLIGFYGATSRVAGKTGAAIATFFMMLTPEMIAFSSLSMTNVIHAIFASLSIIYFALWFQEKEKKDLLLCGVLLGANIWCRTEGIVFTGAALLLLFIDAIRTKQYKTFLPVSAFALVPLICWMLYTKINGFHAQSIAITHLFWDAEKMNTIFDYVWMLYTNTQYYGWSFIVFLMAFICNIWFLIKKRDSLNLFIAIVLASVFYMIVLYQIDYNWDSIINVLSYSAKRFLFCFIPILWYYSFSNQAVRTVFRKLEHFLAP
jgi:uncharacterized membrane protein (UPF0136 family)